jgi:hypothetical protein
VEDRLGRSTRRKENQAMNKNVIVREALIFLATCVAFAVLAVILPVLFKIELWPILTKMPFAALLLPFYVLVRWMQCRRRSHS